MSTSPNEDSAVEWAVDTLKSTPPTPLPEGFLNRFEARLSEEPLPGSGFLFASLFRSRSLMAALLVMAALGGLWLILPTTGGSDSPSFVSIAGESTGPYTWEQGRALTTQDDRGLTLQVPGHDVELKLTADTKAVLREIDIDEKRLDAEVELLQGTVFVNEEQSKVAIVTKRARIIPIGTQYIVTESEAVTEVVVLSGEVKIEQGEGRSPVRLLANERVRLTGEGLQRSQEKIKLPSRSAEKWRRQFLNETPAPILGKVEPEQRAVASKQAKDRTAREDTRPVARSTPTARARVRSTPEPAATVRVPVTEAKPGPRVSRRVRRKLDLGPRYPRARVVQGKPSAQAKGPSDKAQGRKGSGGPDKRPRARGPKRTEKLGTSGQHRRENRKSGQGRRKRSSPYDGPAAGSWRNKTGRTASYPSQGAASAAQSSQRPSQRAARSVRRR